MRVKSHPLPVLGTFVLQTCGLGLFQLAVKAVEVHVLGPGDLLIQHISFWAASIGENFPANPGPL